MNYLNLFVIHGIVKPEYIYEKAGGSDHKESDKLPGLLAEDSMGKKKKSVYCGVGGQAVLEGVMMKAADAYAVAIRTGNGEIKVRKAELDYDPNSILRKIPLIRGVCMMIDSLSLGMGILGESADYLDEEEENPEDSVLYKIFGDKTEAVVSTATMIFSFLVAILLFMVIPYAVSEFLGKWLKNESLILIIEGVIRVVIFLIYVAGIALMKDIRRLYMYHGAEHKVINCIESGKALTVENVMSTTRFHKRCGTSFMLLVVLIGIVACFFIRTDSFLLRIVFRLLLIPVVAGVAYELIRLAGTRDGILLDIISAPGLWLQRVTTKEPTEDMVEVGIAAVEAVFDWEKFQTKNFKKKKRKKTETLENGEIVDLGEETVEIDVLEVMERLNDAEGISKDE